jgi:hypothetical protein
VVKREDLCKDTQILGLKLGEPIRLKAWVASESPSRPTNPYLDVLASMTRAVPQKCPLGIEYHCVDCSPDHSLRRHKYWLWLKDHRPFAACEMPCWRRATAPLINHGSKPMQTE